MPDATGVYVRFMLHGLYVFEYLRESLYTNCATNVHDELGALVMTDPDAFWKTITSDIPTGLPCEYQWNQFVIDRRLYGLYTSTRVLDIQNIQS